MHAQTKKTKKKTQTTHLQDPARAGKLICLRFCEDPVDGSANMPPWDFPTLSESFPLPFDDDDDFDFDFAPLRSAGVVMFGSSS